MVSVEYIVSIEACHIAFDAFIFCRAHEFFPLPTATHSMHVAGKQI